MSTKDLCLMNNKQKLITIVGPTASGKTDLSLALAKKYNGYVIAADSRTIYKEMDIGTAKPAPLLSIRRDGVNPVSTKENFLVKGISHFGINLINPTETFSASEFKKYAENIISCHCERSKEKFEQTASRAEIASSRTPRNDSEDNNYSSPLFTKEEAGGGLPIPFIVGGTGLYVSAIVDNLSFPAAPPNETFRKEKNAVELSVLVSNLLQKDPEAEKVVDLKNKRRVIRALEVINHTGKLFSDLYKKGPQKYNVLMLGVKRDREEIYKRVNARVDQMLTQGFEEECINLRGKYGCNAPGMSAIGYSQFCKYLNGELSKEEAVENWKQAEKNYAKRQFTWFNKDKRIHWVKNTQEAEKLIESYLSS